MSEKSEVRSGVGGIAGLESRPDERDERRRGFRGGVEVTEVLGDEDDPFENLRFISSIASSLGPGLALCRTGLGLPEEYRIEGELVRSSGSGLRNRSYRREGLPSTTESLFPRERPTSWLPSREVEYLEGAAAAAGLPEYVDILGLLVGLSFPIMLKR